MMSVCFDQLLPMKTDAFFMSEGVSDLGRLLEREVIRTGIYSQIKEQVSTRAVAEYYGHRVNRNGMMRCPFHDDKRPSMKVDQNFICFGCQEKGDVIDFAARLFGMTPYDAAGKLIADMGLTVTAENRPDVQPGTRQRAKRERLEQKQFEQAVSRIYNLYCDYFRLLNEWAEEYAPRSPDEDLHPLFAEAMHQRDYVEYLLDLLLYGSREDKAFVLIEKGKGVNELEKRIRKFDSGRRERSSRSVDGRFAGDDHGTGPGDARSDGERSGPEHGHKRGNNPVL